MFECLRSINSEAKVRAQALSAANRTEAVEESEESNNKRKSESQNLSCKNTEKPSAFDCLSCALHMQRSISEKKCSTEQTKDANRKGEQTLLHSSSSSSSESQKCNAQMHEQQEEEPQRVKQQITGLLSYVLQQEEKQQLESFFSSCANEQSEKANSGSQVTEMDAKYQLNALYNNLPLLYTLSSRCNDNLTSQQTLSRQRAKAENKEEHQGNKKEKQELQNEQDDRSLQYQCEFEAIFTKEFNLLLSSQEKECTRLSSREIDYLREHFPNTFGVLLAPSWLHKKQSCSYDGDYPVNTKKECHDNNNTECICGTTRGDDENDNIANLNTDYGSCSCCCSYCHCKSSLNSLRLITPYSALEANKQTRSSGKADKHHEPHIIDVDDERQDEEKIQIGKNRDEQAQQMISQSCKGNEANKENNINSGKAKNSFSFNVTSDKINVNNGQTIRARSPPPLFPRPERNEESVNISVNQITQRCDADEHGKGTDYTNTTEKTMTSFFSNDNNSSSKQNIGSSGGNNDKHARQKTLEDFSINSNSDSKECRNKHLLETTKTQNKKTPYFSSLARMQEEEQHKNYFSFTSSIHTTAPPHQKKAINSGASSANNSQDSQSERSKDFVTAGAQLLADVKAGRAGALASALAKTHAPALGLRRPGFQPPFHNNNPNNNTNNSNNEYYNDEKAAHVSNIPVNKVLSSVINNSSNNNKGKRQRAVDINNNSSVNNSGTAMAENEEGNGENDYPASLLLPDGSVPPLLLPLDASLVRQVAYEILENANTSGGSSNSNNSSKSKIGWDDIAGLQHAKRTIEEAIVWPLKRPDLFTGLRDPPRGLLLFGPPGTGKTMIARAIAHRANCTFINISSSSIMSKWIGDGEKLVRCVFAVAAVKQPSVVFVDEIDSLLSTRMEGETDAVRRVKTEFLVQLDGVATDRQDRVLLIGATNRPDDLDEAARRRLEKRLYIPLPDHDARCELITRLLYTLERDYHAANSPHLPSSHKEEEEEEKQEENKLEKKKKYESRNVAELNCNDHSTDRDNVKNNENDCGFGCDVMEEKSKVKVHTLSVQDIALLAKWTVGFSGADLKQLCREAAMGPLREMTMVQLDAISAHDLRPINLKDFKLALKRMKPSVSSKEVTRYVQWNALFGSFSQIYENDNDEDDDDNDDDNDDATETQQLKSINNSSSVNNSWNGEANKVQNADHNHHHHNYQHIDNKDDKHKSQVLGVNDELATEE